MWWLIEELKSIRRFLGMCGYVLIAIFILSFMLWIVEHACDILGGCKTQFVYVKTPDSRDIVYFQDTFMYQDTYCLSQDTYIISKTQL